MQQLSIVIPVLNEEINLKLQESFFKLLLQKGHEIIIVDGGSNDDSLKVANDIGCKSISTKASRGYQLHAGASISSKEILVFLHVDTSLPVSGLESIIQTLNKSDVFWGRLNVSFANKSFVYKVIAWFMNKRSCLTGVVSGDHTFFIKRETYFDSGGFSDIPIMEDIELSKRLKKYSRPICLTDSVITSSRKWEQHGLFKTILLMWRLRLLYFFGVPAETLVTKYYSN